MSKRLPTWMQDDPDLKLPVDYDVVSGPPEGVPEQSPRLPDWMEDAAPAKEPEVGGVETYFNRATDALPLGKPVVDAAATYVASLPWAQRLAGFTPEQLGESQPPVRLTPQAKQELLAAGRELPSESGFVERYRHMRDMRTKRTAAGSSQNPWAGRLGTATGIASTLPLALPVAKLGTGLVGKALSGIATGAGYGTLGALSQGPADLTKGEFAQAARDVAGVDQFKQAAKDVQSGNYGTAALDVLSAGAPGGAIGGAVLTGVGAAAKPIARPLGKFATNQARRVLLNGADSMTARKILPDEAVREALTSGGMRAFDTTTKSFERLARLVEEQGAKYDDIVTQLEAEGVQGPKARDLADKLFAKAERLDKRTLNRALPEEYLKNAQLIERFGDEGGNLSLSQNEEAKRSMQDMAKYGTIDETPVNVVKRDIASVLRQGTEDAIASAAQVSPVGSKIRELGAQFVPTKQKYGRLATAADAAERGAARVSQRQSGNMPSALETTIALVSGHPEAVFTKPLMNFMKTRGTSAAAVGAHRVSEALQQGTAGSSMARYAGQAAPSVAAARPMRSPLMPAGAHARVTTAPDEMTVTQRPPRYAPVNELKSAIQTNPEVFGQFAPQLLDAANRNDSSLAVTSYMLAQRNPEYRQLLEKLSSEREAMAER